MRILGELMQTRIDELAEEVFSGEAGVGSRLAAHRPPLPRGASKLEVSEYGLGLGGETSTVLEICTDGVGSSREVHSGGCWILGLMVGSWGWRMMMMLMATGCGC